MIEYLERVRMDDGVQIPPAPAPTPTPTPTPTTPPRPTKP